MLSSGYVSDVTSSGNHRCHRKYSETHNFTSQGHSKVNHIIQRSCEGQSLHDSSSVLLVQNNNVTSSVQSPVRPAGFYSVNPHQRYEDHVDNVSVSHVCEALNHENELRQIIRLMGEGVDK